MDVLCECNIAEIILKLKAMKRLKKLSLLSNDNSQKLKEESLKISEMFLC